MAPARRFDLLAVALLAIPAVAALLVWDALPAEMAIHWNAAGVPDNTAAKPLATFGLPLFGVATVAVVRLVPDSLTSTPGGETVTVLFVGVVFAWVETLVLVWNLGYRFNVTLATLPVLVLAAGLVWYAVRTGTR
jgi:uncharacterized membrane protein